MLEAGEGSAGLNATVTNNTVSNFADAVDSLHGIHSDNGILAGDTNAVRLNVSGNSVATAANESAGGADIRVRRGSSTTVAIPGIAGTNNAAAVARPPGTESVGEHYHRHRRRVQQRRVVPGAMRRAGSGCGSVRRGWMVAMRSGPP